MAEPYHPSFAKIALQLIKISSAELERLLSSWSFVHNLKRNCLTFGHSEKLLFIYYALKIEDKESVEY